MQEGALPEGWEWKRLGNVCIKFEHGLYVPKERYVEENGVEMIHMSDAFYGEVITGNLRQISATEKESKKYQLHENDLLVARRSLTFEGAAKTCKLPKSFGKLLFESSLIRIRPDLRCILPSYLYQYLNNQVVRRKFVFPFVTSSTISGINQENLKKICVLLPPLPVQRQIVAVLEQAEALKRQRQEADALTGALLQSVFLEMFGDPVRNERGWPLMKMKDVCTKVTDGTHDTPTPTAVGIPFILGRHIRDRTIDFDNADYLPKKIHDEVYRRCNPEYGDVILVHIGNIGTAAYVNVKFEFSMKNIALLKPNPKILHGRFLETYLIQIKPYIEKIVSRGGIQRFLSIKEMEKIPCITPPLALQQQFARIVADVERIREQQAESKSEIGVLFDGLMAGAFRGGLVAEKRLLKDSVLV